jgi:hypothetical protein
MKMSDPEMDQQLATLIQAGFGAVAQGDWAEARRQFEAVLVHVDLPEAREGLGMAAYWLEDVPLLFDSRERAFRLYRDRGNRVGMARVATSLSVD